MKYGLKALGGAVVAVAITLAVAEPAWAGAVITSGVVSLGVNDEAHLNFPSPLLGVVGIFLAGVGDGISPGCLCEGWGVSASGVSGGASMDLAPFVFNYTSDGMVFGADTATLTGHLTTLPGLSIMHEYMPAISTPAGAVFEVKVTVTNTTGAPATDLRYQRVMDWDIPPTVFSEAITHRGVPAALAGALVTSHDNGFSSVDPLAAAAPLDPASLDVNFEDLGPFADHGSFFKFGFGDLANDSSKAFSIFYGAAYSEAAADAFVAALGLELVSYGQHEGDLAGGTPGTYIFGFEGIGGAPIVAGPVIPEPTSLLLLGPGLAALAWSRRKRVL